MTRTTRNILIGLAIAALVGLFLIGIIVAAAVTGWKAAQRAGNEAATVQNLKTIGAVEIIYFNTHKRAFGTFDELIKEQMLSAKFAGDPAIADGYVLNLKVSNKPQPSFVLIADPHDDSSGRNHFYLDSTSSEIHVNANRGASASDPIQ